ncbi:MAG: hypothetical protein ACM3SQ_00670 [Betaproteobacteria bacterium]
MLDRDKLETVLSRRFPGASIDQIASAANAIMGLDEEWEEFGGRGDGPAYDVSPTCSDACLLAREAAAGAEFRLLRRIGH